MSNHIAYTTLSEDLDLQEVFEALSESYRDKITAVLDALCERFEEELKERQSRLNDLQTQLDEKA